MDPLKIFATLETALSEAQLLEYWRGRGWSQDKNTHSLRLATCRLQLEYSGDGLYSIRGEIPRAGDLDLLLEPLIRNLCPEQAQLHLDVFEEDGRLVKRIQL